MSPEISIDEWVAELERLSKEKSDEGLTSAEWKDLLPLPEVDVQKLLKKCVLSGQMVRGERVVERDWDGRKRRYAVYAVRRQQ